MSIHGNDRYAGVRGGIDSPLSELFVITPHDSTLLAQATRALWVGGTGDISVLPVGQTVSVTLVGVPAGQWLPLRVARVNATGTTATDLVGGA